MLPLLAALLAPPALNWVGYQEVDGVREVPFLGEVKTKTRTWFVAERRPDPGGGFTLVQRPCRMTFRPAMGIQVAMSDATVRRLPPATATFHALGDDSLGADWTVGWGQEDVDGDGHPGASVQVSSKLCSGALRVASESRTRARARHHAGALEARLIVDLRQRILGATGACLKMTASDTTEVLRGWMRLVAVDGEARCDRWPPSRWPAFPAR